VAAQQGVFQINLIPKDSFEFSPLGRFLSWATTTGRVLVVLTEFVVLLAFGSRFYFDKRVNDLTEEVEQKQVQIETFAETEKQMRKILAKQSPVNTYLSENLTFGQKYDNLSKTIPRGVHLEKLTINDTGMGMVGESESELGFAQLLRSLKRMEGVANLSMKDTTFEQTSGSVKFNIQATFKNGSN